jgi:hypothetical protein
MQALSEHAADWASVDPSRAARVAASKQGTLHDVLEAEAASAFIRVRGSAATGALECRMGYRIPRPDRGIGVADGAWYEWAWDGARLNARTSRHGMPPLYYAHDDHQILLSGSIAALLRHGAPQDLDWDALGIMVRLGHCIGDRTPYRFIRVLPADATLQWTNGALTIQAGARNAGPQLGIRPDDAIERYVDLVKRAVQRRLPQGTFTVPLSGGRDSRHILLELAAAGYKPDIVYTAGHYLSSSEGDRIAAAAVATRMGIVQRFVPSCPRSLMLEYRKNVRTDFCALEHGWGLTFASELAQYDSVYDGLNGGILFGRGSKAAERFRALAEGRCSEVAAAMLNGNDGWMARVLRPEIVEALSRENATRLLTAELERHVHAINPIQSYYYWNRVARSTTYYSHRLFTNRFVHCPLDDMDLVDFAMRLPPAISLDSTFQTRALRARFSAFANVPFAEDVPHAAAPAAASGRDDLREILRLATDRRGQPAWENVGYIMTRGAIAWLRADADQVRWWMSPLSYLLQLREFTRTVSRAGSS